MEELIVINVVIADRTYRLKTRPNDEETIRKTAKLINEKIIEFRTAFGGKDMQDYVSMVLLWFAVEQTKPDGNVVAESEAGHALAQINSLLDKALSSP